MLLRTAWRSFVGTAWYATITTVLAAVAGLLGSVYGEEISAAFPFHWGPVSRVSWKAVGFWSSLLLFAFLFYHRQRHDDRNRRRLEKSTNRVEALVETLPPKAFRTQFATQVRVIDQALSRVLPRQPAEALGDAEIVAFIRSVLQSIANLALVYDDSPLVGDRPSTYAANLMLFVPVRDGEPPLPPAVRDAMRFMPSGYDVRQLKGVLYLRPDLSATTAQSEPDPDPGMAPLALPVPREIKRGARWLVLPGAPKAFSTLKVDGYADAFSLATWCAEKGDFPPSVQEEIREYFTGGAGAAVRSFISRPLYIDDDEPFAVLNIHADRTNILGPAVERSEIFQALLTPLLLELARAVQRLKLVDKVIGVAEDRPPV